MRLHIDTDFAGDPDDACAVAMTLGWPGAELMGVTTTADPDGRRAGYLQRFLAMAGRQDVPIAAGAGRSLTTGRTMGGIPDHDRYWGTPVGTRPSPTGVALDLLTQSIERGATIAAIGPWTNLALLEAAQPGRLGSVPVVAMGGWETAMAHGYPPWGPGRDWNVQCDSAAASTVISATENLTLSTIPETIGACLRRVHLPRLLDSGPIGRLLARQSAEHAIDNDLAELAARHTCLPDDLVNFHWDPVACAAALGWTGLRLRNLGSRRIVVDVHAEAFAATWIEAVERAQA